MFCYHRSEIRLILIKVTQFTLMTNEQEAETEEIEMEIISSHSFRSEVIDCFVINKVIFEIYADGKCLIKNGENTTEIDLFKDSPIVQTDLSPDGSEIAYICQSNSAYLVNFHCESSENILYLGDKIVYLRFVSGKSIILVDNENCFFYMNLDATNSRKMMFRLENTKINDIVVDKKKDILYISTQNGLFYCENAEEDIKPVKIIEEEVFCVEINENLVYYLSKQGLNKINGKSTSNLLRQEEMIKYNMNKEIGCSRTSFIIIGDNFLICTPEIIYLYSLEHDKIISILKKKAFPFSGLKYNNDFTFFVYTTKELLMIHINTLEEIEKYKQDQELKRMNLKIDMILKAKAQKEKVLDLASLVKDNPNHAKIILPIFMQQYIKLKNDEFEEIYPIAHGVLNAYKGHISFEKLYRILRQHGKENEIWKFNEIYDLADEPFALNIIDQCKLDMKTAIRIIPKSQKDSLPIAELIDRWPGLSSIIYNAVGDIAAPFIIKALEQMNHIQIKELYKCLNGTCSLLEVAVREKLNKKSINYKTLTDPFIVLQCSKNKQKWIIASQIAFNLGMEDEYKSCKSKQGDDIEIESKDMQTSLNLSKQTENFMNLIHELEFAGPNHTFGEFAEFAKSITRKLDDQIQQSQNRTKEQMQVIERLNKQRMHVYKQKKSLQINHLSQCSYCHKALGHNKVIVYPCHHCFHLECKEVIEEQIVITQKQLYRQPMIDGTCPLCGTESTILCRAPLTNSQIEDEWKLKL